DEQMPAVKAGRWLTTAGAGSTAEKHQKGRKGAWIFKPEICAIDGSSGSNIKLIQYIVCIVALIQQYCPPGESLGFECSMFPPGR
ncbi:hypothetical protein RZS08_19760, partial [Arthrospira platensis SPKY1]|nr:hypothetical protein [Arthrospira platensis SPKY1]